MPAWPDPSLTKVEINDLKKVHHRCHPRRKRRCRLMTAGIEKYLTYLKAKDYSPSTLIQRSHLERFSSYMKRKTLASKR